MKRKIRFPQRKKKGKLFFIVAQGMRANKRKEEGSAGNFLVRMKKGGKKRKGGFVFLSKVFYGSAMALAPGRKVG